MNDGSFFALFAFLIIAMFLVGVDSNLSNDVATSTSAYSQSPNSESIATRNSGGSIIRQNNSAGDTTSTEPELSNDEIKEELEDLYDELWELEQNFDSAIRRQPVSRYADQVTLRATHVNRDPDEEYLTLTANPDVSPIDISRWYIESYVTDKRAGIPNGSWVLTTGGSVQRTDPIVLEPNQQAYLITGDSPFDVSFQENMCSGYLAYEETITPRLSSNSCMRPIDMLERYSDIALDDDSCYDFVEQVRRCESVDYDDSRLSSLSGTCRSFVRNYLSYNSCVERFSNRTEFDDYNDWYIYFERNRTLWRNEREIIRLIDEFDDVVAVIEY